METEYEGETLCIGCSEGSCLEHCEICGSRASIWGCHYSFPRASARPPSSASFEFRGLPEWRCKKPDLPTNLDRGIAAALIVIGAVLLDFFLGGWLIQQNLSALWSFLVGR